MGNDLMADKAQKQGETLSVQHRIYDPDERAARRLRFHEAIEDAAGVPSPGVLDAVMRAAGVEIKAVFVDLTELLRRMDRTQRETDEAGGREIAWYYFRDEIEAILGLERGALDTEREIG